MGAAAHRRHYGESGYLDTEGSPRRGESAEADTATDSGQVVVPGEQPQGANPRERDEHVTETTPIEDAQSALVDGHEHEHGNEVPEDEGSPDVPDDGDETEGEGEPENPADPEPEAKAEPATKPRASRKASSK